MAEKKRLMKFTVDKKTKRPKPPCESNSAFALYAYRRMKLETGHLVHEYNEYKSRFTKKY